MMSKNDNNAEINALLNAYLDGELTPAKREKVEQMLESNSQARQMYEDLKNISGLTNSLPRASAPPELIRDVLMDLERDLLLDKSDDLAELAGRKHLAFRRFAAAAAMIALTGAIAFIIHSTWSEANTLPKTSDSNSQKINIAKNNGIENDPLIPVNGNGPGNDIQIVDNTSTKSDPPIVIPPLDFPELKYSSLALVVRSDDGRIGRIALEELLAEENISNPMVQSIDQQKKQYAFLCSLDQFKELFRAINQNSLHPIDLNLTDPAGNYQISLAQASLSEAMKLAAEGNRLIQVANLMQLASYERINFTGDTSEIAEAMQTYMAGTEPALDDMHISGSQANTASSTSSDPNNISAEPYKPAIQPGIMANKPNPGSPPDIQKAPSAQSEPVEKVAVLLTLQIIPAEPAPVNNVIPEMFDGEAIPEPTGSLDGSGLQEMPAPLNDQDGR